MKAILTEQELLVGLAKGDRIATEYIYKENYNLIKHFVLKNNGSVDDAADIYQESMVVLYENALRSDFALTCQIKTFLYSIARRLWLKKLHQLQRYSGNSEELAEHLPLEEEMEFKERQDNDFKRMEIAMNSLGEPCRSLLQAFYLESKNMADIAEDFGYTNSDNAKNQKYKCLMRLKKLFFAQS